MSYVSMLFFSVCLRYTGILRWKYSPLLPDSFLRWPFCSKGQISKTVHNQYLLIWLVPTSKVQYGLTHCLYSLPKFLHSKFSSCLYHSWFDTLLAYHILSSVVRIVPLMFSQYGLPYTKLNLPCVPTYSKTFFHGHTISCIHLTANNSPNHWFTAIVTRM